MKLLTLISASVCLGSLSIASGRALSPFKPTPSELRQAYRDADALRGRYAQKAFKLTLVPHWYDGDTKFWYQNDLAGGKTEYISVDVASGHRGPAFDQPRLATLLSAKLGHQVDPSKLPIGELHLDAGSMRFNAETKAYACDLGNYELKEIPPVTPVRRPPPEPWTQNLWPADKRDVPSPDGAWVARNDGNNVRMRPKGGGAEFALTDAGSPGGYFAREEWRPDSKKIVAMRVVPGDRKPVYLIQSSPPGGGRSVLHTRPYDLPGDKEDTFEIWLLDPTSHESAKIDADPVDYGEMPGIRWMADKKHFTYEKMDRGYQRWRVFSVDSDTGETRTLIDDQSKTFVDSTSQYIHYCDNDEMIWRSERDGWGHLYLVEPNGVIQNQITKGQWVVRGVDRVDEKERQIVFHASGMNSGEDPYFNHYYRINFDGTGLTPLTPVSGDHLAIVSPDGKELIDTYSTVSNPPVHELRRVTDGALLCSLEKADISGLVAAGWHAPEVFVSKGRDGKTDIWGLVYRPSHFDAGKSYPIIEDIYAGPHDSFVPKTFAPYRSDQSLAELGFIVVKVDGMGTRNRSKAFQDVCWKNLADAGFPDRILWMKALARKYSYVDIDRVGIYGTSAGGQESTAALLFHPEFYKVAVSSCGCQDNRMDKIWWNEQWMGYPVGAQYEESSNIENAGRLKGKLLLFVGEMDTNVPPESTIRLVDALMKARREFSFLIIPGSDHTDGGPYGERKRRDFFVHNLLGVEPPDWNTDADPPGGSFVRRRG